jgi:putative phosphoesterase
MLIGIISDSHDNIPAIRKAVNIFNERNVDIVLHAGDYVSSFTAQEFGKLKMKLVGVFGNNDGDKLHLLERFKNIGTIHQEPFELELDNKKISLMHQIDKLDKDKKFDIVIYGHSHKLEIIKGLPLIINPGECGGWITGRNTAVILNTKTVVPEIIDL